MGKKAGKGGAPRQKAPCPRCGKRGMTAWSLPKHYATMQRHCRYCGYTEAHRR